MWLQDRLGPPTAPPRAGQAPPHPSPPPLTPCPPHLSTLNPPSLLEPQPSGKTLGSTFTRLAAARHVTTAAPSGGGQPSSSQESRVRTAAFPLVSRGPIGRGQGPSRLSTNESPAYRPSAEPMNVARVFGIPDAKPWAVGSLHHPGVNTARRSATSTHTFCGESLVSLYLVCYLCYLITILPYYHIREG